MTIVEFNNLLDQYEISFYETGSYYDTNSDEYQEQCIDEIERVHLICVIDW